MIDIEKRRYFVEKLVSFDLQKTRATTGLVTITIVGIILVMIFGGLFYRPLVSVGEKSLNELKLPLINM
ncbi:MAG: hypothetical protein F6K17_14475 [Okeania sp. SIO3C4]|nr:hypothetical protein [Okeania sp. SIO3C4]